MKYFITTILLATNLLLSGGCAAIGIETIFGKNMTFKHYQLKGDIIGGGEIPIEINLGRVHTKNDVIRKLGKPDKEKKKYIFYSEGEKEWRGIAIDLAVFIPLSLPLTIPVGESGVKFWHDRNGNLLKATRYTTRPTFYGFYNNCDGTSLWKKDEFSIWFD